MSASAGRAYTGCHGDMSRFVVGYLPDQCRRNLFHAVTLTVNNQRARGYYRDRDAQDFGVKSQDQADPFALSSNQTMPGKDKMEIEIAFKTLAFFAAFMAARSLTAYFKEK